MGHLRVSNVAARPALAAVLRYGLAIASVAAAFGLSLILVHNHLPRLFGSFSFAAIAFAFWYLGMGPGLLAVLISCLAFDFFLFPITEVRGFGWQSFLAIYATFAVLVGWFSASRRRAERLLAEARDNLEKRVGDRTSELTRANEELRVSQARFRALSENAPAAIFIYQGNNFIYANPATEAITGYSDEELLNMNFWDIAHPDFRQLVRDRGLARQRGELVPLRYEFKILTKAGEERWLDFTDGQFEFDGKLAVVGMAFDITEGRRVEEALRRSENELRLVIDTIPVMAWTVRPDGVVDFLNRRWMDYSGISLEQYVADPTGPIHPEDVARVLGKWRLQMALGEAYGDEMRLRRADGEYRWFLVRTAPLRDEQGNIVKWYGVSIDIEDRERAEEALKESETKLKQAQELAHIGYWEFDLTANRITPSEEARKILGRELPNGVLDRAEFEEVIHPDDRELRRRALNQALQGSRPFDVEVRVVRPDGDIRFVHVRDEIVYDNAGKPIRMFGAVQDITERKRAEGALRRAEELFRAIVEDQTEMIVRWKPDGTRTFVNKAYCSTFGKSYDELVGTSFWPLVAEPYRERELERIRNLTPDSPLSMGVHESLLPDGTTRWQEWSDRGLFDEQGHLVELQSVGRDITERKRAEQALRESRELLHLVLATLPVGVAVTDQGGDIILTNAASKRIWSGVIVSGHERWEQTKGFWHDSGQRIAPGEWASVRALSEGQTSLNELIDIETYDGRKRTIQNSAAPIRNAEGQIVGTVIVNEDVTERVGAEQALRESGDRLQRLSRRLLEVQEEERRHLARELHDEFGQLLATITLHLHVAKGLAREAAQSHLNECTALLQRAGEQVRSLALELRPTMLETAGLEATLRWLAAQHEQRTGIAVQLVGHLDGMSSDLAAACFRVAQEALTNIVRHAGAHHVWIELSESESFLELVIRDDGVGFDAERTLKEAAQRGRLGLLGMSERVRILGGSLEVNSEPGHGTCIRAIFPLTKAVAEAAKSVE